MPKKRTCTLSIAGFDPSGGAGLLADIKTFEQHKVLGMGANTGNTFQNDSEFEGVAWTPIQEIQQQIDVLCKKFHFDFIKIGMIKDIDTLQILLKFIKTKNPKAKIIWDPIIKASAGFEIHASVEKEMLNSILKNIYLVTPNLDEIKFLAGDDDEIKSAKEFSKYCNVFLKGGHATKQTGTLSLGRDLLITTNEKIFPFKAKKISSAGKHGSGCVLSAAITANLANGLSLQRACLKGKDYVTKYLISNKELLGYHKI